MDRQNVARRRLMGRPDPAAVTLLAAEAVTVAMTHDTGIR